MSLEEVGPGQTFGSYEVLEELGRGGMGRVFRARHVTLEREVALKLLAGQFSEDEFYVQRFLKEARAAARLNHPGIVQIYDFGQVGAHWYLAMELVEGRSLAHFLKTWGRFSEQNAIVLARQTLAALGVAHAAGIVHRDIKPDNVILGKKGVVKLVDLGLAKRIDDPGASSTGFAAGTPYYISPEQIEGRADVDGRADLYSLGASLFQLVTGQVPFPGSSSAVIMSRHLNERAPDPRTFTPELSEGFCAAVLRLLARERDRRPKDAGEAEREFAALQAAQSPAAAAFHPLESAGGAAPDGVPSTPSPRPLPTPSNAGAASGPGTFPPALLAAAEKKLAAEIGPLARVLVKQEAKRQPTWRALVEALSTHVPEEAGRRRLRETLAPLGV